MSHHDGLCISGGLASTLAVHLLPQGANTHNFSFPPLPPSGDTYYSYALEKAMVALAPGCVAAFSTQLEANADNGPGTERNLWVGRIDELPAPEVVPHACGRPRGWW